MEDQGFTVSREGNEVVMKTDKAVTTIAMTSDQAISIATILLKLAQEIINSQNSN